jgi:hypothetical protein
MEIWYRCAAVLLEELAVAMLSALVNREFMRRIHYWIGKL